MHHALANDTHRLTGAAGRLLQCLAAAECMDTHELALACALEDGEVSTTLVALADLGFVARC